MPAIQKNPSLNLSSLLAAGPGGAQVAPVWVAQVGAVYPFETTLASKIYANYIKEAQTMGYTVTLVFFWLRSPELALERVLARVLAGGHNIPEDVIRRRYKAGLRNLSNIYIPLCDYWMIIDNSYYPSKLIAEGNQNLEEMVYVEDIYKKILGS